MPGSLQNTNFSFLLPLFGSAFHCPPPLKFYLYLSLSLSVDLMPHCWIEGTLNPVNAINDFRGFPLPYSKR
jgi:hypothetical protein